MWRNKQYEEKIAEIDKRCCEALSENLELKEQLSLLKDAYDRQQNVNDEMQRIYSETRRLKHDMRNHLLVIASYLNDNKTEEAKKYTSDIIDKMELEYSYISSGNGLLNYLLNEKFAKAKEQGVYIKADIENLSFAKISGIDFAAIFGNLLDNAFDAACKSTEKQMWVRVKNKRGYDTIRLSNSIDNSVLAENPMLKTSKKDHYNHGMGVRQAQYLVEKYNGIFDVWEEYEMFHVQIMFEKDDNDKK